MFYMMGAIVMMKGCLLVRKRRIKKTKKGKSLTSRSYLIKQSKNGIEGGENNKTEEEEEDRKLTKDKMHKGLESESEGDEQLEKVTIPKKGKGSKAEKPYPTCNTRSSPKPMYEAMMTLSDPQKKCLKDMGFERMIHFPIVELPSALAYHAIDHFHTGSMELRLEKGSIKATRQKVQDMLGIPMGSRKLEDLEQRPSNDPFIKEWEKQFKHVQKPTPTAIASVISDTTEVDFIITEDVDISDIDWCGYILDCLHTSKKNWKDVKTRKNFYYGPLTFLCLLYLDSTIFPDLRVLHHRPALRSWNTTTMRKRIKMETETRRLGKLEHHEEFDPEEEQDGMNVYKGLDVYVAPINDKEPETKEQYEELFNDNEFNLYESSKDNDSEGEPDGDNENNNHDDDGAPTADANKKKESENQKKERKKEEIDKQTEESGSEGTEESGSEGTEENGSEATEGGSDGKEENMNGDEREVTAQMDVNNQNKELNKEKDANETEDNDKMNNNDMKNDSVQEKQDTNKDENAKVDNVQEKQADDKDEIGEDEFWNTQFTDSQCEELENQAKEEIKKKTAKRKTVIEMTPPSFSLGLSPDTNKVEERAAKRVKKPSRFIVSPYINKKTATKGNAVQDEMMICSYLFSMEGSELDFIFETKEGNATIRDYMQTLAPTLKIESNVIDTYCLVLNHEQGVNNKGNKTKHFFHTGMITKDMFNWKMEDGKKYDEKNMFSMHLKEVQHPRAKNVLNKKPTILRPKWGTEENNTDCGVFLMMHMENYNGENARNWNLEFPTEEEGNRYDITKMRMRFAAKMLSHEINIHREEMSKQALEFADRNKEKKAMEALIRGAIRVKKEKQEYERVRSAI
ncbi:ulp1 protease family, C-terminal catalytic domain-containing protein [Tanacetum coccineum]|uniref:Ulp1 protease family, C-terminal catalytic domain-containing protein n=1 Tax=Tanacetum coccineum TaxID=301880 RepID=A0ABQ5GTX0_9ASTR